MSKIISQKNIQIDNLKVDAENVRHSTAQLKELEDSIAKYGVIEPIIVRKMGDDYHVVAGGLRMAAAQAAGLREIPAIVKEMTDEEAFIESAIENIQRHQLSPDEEAQTYAKAYKLFGSQEKVAKAFAKGEGDVQRQLEAARMVGLMREVYKDAHARPQIPQDTTKVTTISRAAKDVFNGNSKKQVEMFDALKDRPRDEVKRAITYIKAKAQDEPEIFEEKPITRIVKDAFKVANASVTIQFSSKTTQALVKASDDTGLTWEDITRIATESWLSEKDYLE